VKRDTVKPPLPPGLALAWGIAPASRRGPKPTHSVQEIVRAAIELADAQGITAVSLPKIARRVGLTANALYRYVGSKDELLVLLYDAGWGPPPKAPIRARTWRKGASAWAHAVIDGYRTRPWLLDVPIRSAPMTPYVLHWLEVFLQAMAASGLSAWDGVRCAQLLDGYARSIARLARDLSSSDGRSMPSTAGAGFLSRMLQERGLPILASTISIMTSGHHEAGALDDDVEFGLNRILDGIEVLVRTEKH
jgi:AcrR family transcriptional regulator